MFTADKLAALRARFANGRSDAVEDPDFRKAVSLVFKPDQLYETMRNIAPDLIVQFGGLYSRPIGSVGHPGLYVQENDSGLDGCNHTQQGMFVMVAPNNPLRGEYEGARLLDMAPTLLDLAGHKIPETMQGRSLVAGMEKQRPADPDADAERIIHERLAGLGYV